MTERTPCARCGRAIDATAGVCPFCNWNQAAAAPAPQQFAGPSPAAMNYTPPEPYNIRRMVLIGIGVMVMLMGAFFVGMVINSDGAPARAPETLEEQAAEHNSENTRPRRADTPLVPAGMGGVDKEPITSAPIASSNGAPLDEYQRSDATAVSAEEYARMAGRAQAEKKKMAVLVDPRSITGAAYTQEPRAAVRGPSPRRAGLGDPREPAAAPRVARRSTVRTRPVPQYQPLPAVHGQGKARFTLVIGPDGRVKDVNVEEMLSGGNTAALIGAIQSWRFKPATENGEPITAPYSVEISFRRE